MHFLLTENSTRAEEWLDPLGTIKSLLGESLYDALTKNPPKPIFKLLDGTEEFALPKCGVLFWSTAQGWSAQNGEYTVGYNALRIVNTVKGVYEVEVWGWSEIVEPALLWRVAEVRPDELVFVVEDAIVAYGFRLDQSSPI